MYTLTHYQYIRSIPLSQLPKKDRDLLNSAISAAEQSSFEHSHRLGACLEYGPYILRGSK